MRSQGSTVSHSRKLMDRLLNGILLGPSRLTTRPHTNCYSHSLFISRQYGYAQRMAKRAERSSVADDIDAIFHPRSIAVVGASANPDTPGYDYLNSLKQFGYKGHIYPVNPKGGEILGLAAYASLRDVPGDVDYVISCIPSDYILDLVRDCAAKNVKALQ